MANFDKISFTTEAEKFKVKGLNPIPLNDQKRPALSEWAPFQDRMMSAEEINQHFNKSSVHSIGIICGPISGNLQVIDIDAKYDLSGSLAEDYMADIEEAIPGIMERLLVVGTRNNGYHLYFRCSQIEGNQELAKRPATKTEREAKPGESVKVLIETRATGGYVVAPPSPGYQRKSGKGIPDITPEERAILFSIARSRHELNDYVDESPKQKDKREFSGLTAFDDYNQKGDVIAVLEKHGWITVNQRGSRIFMLRPGETESKTSGNFHTEKRLFRSFSSSTLFNSEKAYNPVQVYALLECENDFSRASKQLYADGYGDRQRKMETAEGQFWEVSENNKISIVRTRLIGLLASHGFALYFLDKKVFIIIRIENSLVEEVAPVEITQFINNYIGGLPESFDGITNEKLKEVFYRGIDTYSSKTFLSLLPAANPEFLKDTRDRAYFTFSNGTIEVGAGGKLRMVSLGQLGKVVWKSQVKDFEVKIDPDYNILDGGNYSAFVMKTANDDLKRNEYAMSLTGYLLHRYKDPAHAYAIILAEETEKEDEGGGTGKGLFIKGIGKLRNVVTIDGKTDKADKSFRFQRVGPDTDIICVEDCKKNPDFESYYPVITEGITIEKKNQQEVFVDYSASPKIAFTTNYTISNIGNHAKRRQRVLEFSNFFSPTRTPENFFGELLFIDWEADEWNRFYNYMFWCVGLYLNNGIREIDNSISIRRKQVKQNFSEEFLDWWDEYSKNGRAEYRLFSDMYNDFVKAQEIEVRNFSKIRFRKGLEHASSLFGLKLEKDFSTAADGVKNKPMYRVVDR